MKIAAMIVRSLMGLLFLFASVTYFFKLITPPPAEGAMKVMGDGFEASIYLMPTVKIVELVCGLALVTGRFVPLATVLIAPINVNIFLVHAFLDRKGLPVAAVLVMANIFLAYVYRERFKPILKAR